MQLARYEKTPTAEAAAILTRPPATTQASGDFFALPAEIRNRIYELCIDPGKVLEIHWTDRKGFSALTQVNQQMRYETISYYQSYQDLRIHSCMEHRHRLRFFLDGPGRMIVPYMRNFELHFRDSELTIMLPDKTAKLEIIHVFMSGGRGSTETQQQEDARLEKLDAIEAVIRDLLDVKVTCRADGGYWISCDVLKEVHKMCSDFDDRAFGCACGNTTF